MKIYSLPTTAAEQHARMHPPRYTRALARKARSDLRQAGLERARERALAAQRHAQLELMVELSISCERGVQYRYRSHRHERLEDAVAYPPFERLRAKPRVSSG